MCKINTISCFVTPTVCEIIFYTENWRAYSDKQPCSSSQPQDFQCQTCDLVMNSKSQLQHHLISPKHKGMVALSKQGYLHKN